MKRITKLSDLKPWDEVVLRTTDGDVKAKILMGDGIKWLLSANGGTIRLNSKTLRVCKIYK